MRYMGLLKATPETEAGAMPPPELFEKMGAFVEEAVKAGVLLGSEGLKPSSFGMRIKVENGKVSVVDGPFTESKELVAGYAIMQAETKEEMVHWVQRFLEVLGGGECEMRPIFEATDFPPEIMTPEAVAHEDELREGMARNASR